MYPDVHTVQPKNLPSSTYHTVVINGSLEPIEKKFKDHEHKKKPDDQFWITQVENQGQENRKYKVQFNEANGDHTTSDTQHAIFSAFLRAYNSHEDIVLSPDDIWLMVCIYFSNFVNQNSEQLRSLFVDHEGKTLLTIVQVGLFEPDWKDFLERMREQISTMVKNDILHTLQADFSTTGPIESLLSCVTIMDTFKSYFEYMCFITRCGIRRVHFMGTLDDWEKLRHKTKKLRDFVPPTSDFATYIDGLLPIFREFIKTYKNEVNHTFWNKVMDIDHVGNGESGREPGDYISGWFLHLCYGLHDKKSCHVNQILLRSLVTPVKVVNEITNQSKMCYLAGGFHGINSSDGRHKPVMSLAIMDDLNSVKVYKKKAKGGNN